MYCIRYCKLPLLKVKMMKERLLTYLQVGEKSSNTEEENRRIFIIHLFSLIGMSITGVTAFFSFINSNYLLSFTLCLSSLTFAIGSITQKITGNHRLSSGIILYLLYLLMFYLLYSGGVNNTGPIWIFMTAPVTLFICGLRLGIINLVIFTTMMSFILFSSLDFSLKAQYPLDFKLRLIYSFLTVSALSAFYEYSRESSYRSMLEISKKFEILSRLDPLTQLSNRRDATNIIEYEQRKLARNKISLSLILCDVDNFKKVNDQFGHDVGDTVLTELANIFKKCIRDQDTVARWGGEEFLFILPNTNTEQAITIAQKIHKAIENSNPLFEAQTVATTVSMGLSTITNDKAIELAISTADKNLYKAKRNGKNRTHTNSGEIIPD